MSRLLKTNLPWLSNLIEDTQGSARGIPEGSWITLVGPPGSGKTTVGLVIANALLACPKTVGLYINKEMSQSLRQRLVNGLKLENISDAMVHEQVQQDHFLALLAHSALNAEKEDCVLVVLVDSLQMFYDVGSTKSSVQLAEALDNYRRNHRVVLITVGHVNKNRQYSGAAKLIQLPDVLVNTSKDASGFFHLDTTQKNRYYKPGGSPVVKLQRTADGLVPTMEPDFVSNNAVIAAVRKLFRNK